MPKVGFKFNPEQKEHMRIGHLGQVAWNKGKKLCDHALESYGRLPGGAPICWICKHKNTARYRVKNREKINYKNRLARYRLSSSVFQQLWASQSGLCAVCGELLDPIKYRIDHDHQTGEVRGILCISCNSGIGFFKESPKNLIQAVRYLSGNESG